MKHKKARTYTGNQQSSAMLTVHRIISSFRLNALYKQ